MTPNTAPPPQLIADYLWPVAVIISAGIGIFLLCREMLLTRQQLKKMRLRRQTTTAAVRFGMQRELDIGRVVSDARARLEAGMNIYGLRPISSEADMRTFVVAHSERCYVGYMIHRTDIDAVFVYVGGGPYDDSWRQIRSHAARSYIEERNRIADREAAAASNPPAQVVTTLGRRRFLPLYNREANNG